MKKLSGVFGAIITLFFSSVITPVLMQMLTQAEDSKLEFKEAPIGLSAKSPFAIVEDRITAQGQGATPEEAWYDAQRNALQAAVASMVDAQTWANDSKIICATLFQDAGRLITRCQDLGCTRERSIWRREVAVFVARAELANKLRTALVRVVGDATH
jgi:hypothetical protein